MTVYDNVALSPRLRGIKDKAELDIIVERCLTAPPCGTRSRTDSTPWAACSPAASSSA